MCSRCQADRVLSPESEDDITPSKRARAFCFVHAGYCTLIGDLLVRAFPDEKGRDGLRGLLAQLKELYGQQRAYLAGLCWLDVEALAALPARSLAGFTLILDRQQQAMAGLRAAQRRKGKDLQMIEDALRISDPAMATLIEWFATADFDLHNLRERLPPPLREHCWRAWSDHLDKLQRLDDLLAKERAEEQRRRRKIKLRVLWVGGLAGCFLVVWLALQLIGLSIAAATALASSLSVLAATRSSLPDNNNNKSSKHKAAPGAVAGAEPSVLAATDSAEGSDLPHSGVPHSRISHSGTSPSSTSADPSPHTSLIGGSQEGLSELFGGDGSMSTLTDGSGRVSGDAGTQSLPPRSALWPGWIESEPSLPSYVSAPPHSTPSLLSSSGRTLGHQTLHDSNSSTDIVASHDPKSQASHRSHSRSRSRSEACDRDGSGSSSHHSSSSGSSRRTIHTHRRKPVSTPPPTAAQFRELIASVDFGPALGRQALGGATATGAHADGQHCEATSKADLMECDIMEALVEVFDTRGARLMEEFEGVRCLGRGNFGHATLMVCPQRGLSFVSKSQPSLELSPSDRQRLENEVRVCATLRHPHIVHYIGTLAVPDKDELHICMEYAAGGSLAAVLDRHRKLQTSFPVEVVATWIAQICGAVSYMHSLRMLHRDLSTANIFFTVAGEVKVGDFGLTKVSINSKPVFARTVCGTPNIFSPELVNGEVYGAPSDAWAVGLLAYELMTLQHPFKGANSLAHLLKQIVISDYDEELLHRANYPDDVKAIASSRPNIGLLHPDPLRRLTVDALSRLPCFPTVSAAVD